MCGIAGIWNLGQQAASLNELRNMLSIQQHRGPEGAAYCRMDQQSLLMGFLKLGFTDNQLGMQPLFNEDGRIAIVYNGEIYDYEQQRAELIQKGHQFYTKSDSEVLIHLYEEHGEDFVHQLNGEFAFVIYDDYKQQIFMARDPFGINPLTYAFHQGHFYFSSEAKGILVANDFERKINPEALTSITIGIPNTALTMFEGIRNLRPGHAMVINKQGIQKHYQYWNPSFEKTADSFETARHKVREKVAAAVHRRLEGRPPIALSLSSGIDSTIITGLNKELGYETPVFSLGYSGRSFDESRMAEISAKHFGLPFHRIDVSIEDITSNFRRTLFHTESTTNSLSNSGRFLMDAGIRGAGLKAITGGEASDEIFGGYPYFILEGLWRMELAGKSAKELFRQFKQNEKQSRRIFWDASRGWKKLRHPYPAPNLAYFRALRANKLGRLWSKAVVQTSERNAEALFLEEVPPGEVQALSGFDLTRRVARSVISTFGFPGLGDRIEMGNSLEGRVPFLDKELIEYAYSLPEEYCLNLPKVQGKRILREAFADLLPPHFLAPPKHTFMSPCFSEAFQTKAGRALYDEYLSGEAARRAGLIRPSSLRLAKLAWKWLPKGSPTYLFVDSLLGLLLSVQILQDIFVEKNPFEMMQGKMLEMSQKSRG